MLNILIFYIFNNDRTVVYNCVIFIIQTEFFKHPCLAGLTQFQLNKHLFKADYVAAIKQGAK